MSPEVCLGLLRKLRPIFNDGVHCGQVERRWAQRLDEIPTGLEANSCVRGPLNAFSGRSRSKLFWYTTPHCLLRDRSSYSIIHGFRSVFGSVTAGNCFFFTRKELMDIGTKIRWQGWSSGCYVWFSRFVTIPLYFRCFQPVGYVIVSDTFQEISRRILLSFLVFFMFAPIFPCLQC